MKTTYLASAFSLIFTTSAFAQIDKLDKEAIHAAQNAWAEGIVEIGQAKTDGKDAEAVASELLDSLYAFEDKVLFKPTKAVDDPFRNSYEEALSYFVGGMLEEDKGFALQPWTAVRFENEDLLIRDDHALAMGLYYFTDTAGNETKVEYTFGYRLDDDGSVKIELHHSSLPFSK